MILEIAVTLVGAALLSWTLGIDGAILGGLCWYAVNAILAANLSASALACGLLMGCIYGTAIAHRAASLPDGELPFSAAPVMLGFMIVGAVAGAILARGVRIRSVAKAE